MVIVLNRNVTDQEIRAITQVLEANSLRTHFSAGEERTLLGVLGDISRVDKENIEVMPGVERIIPISAPYKLASKTFKAEPDVFDLGKGILLGGGHFVNMAGPCSIESYDQLYETAREVRASGARILRGGAYKPRTSPYAFQGTGMEGLHWMREIADELNMLVVSEVMSEMDIEGMLPYVDIFQIGTRNAQNFRLLKAVGQAGKPVMLKRGMAETIEEWLSSTEYILSEGNYKVILCERGIRTFETAYRSTLDIGAIPVLRDKTHLPVIVDPSHAAGNWRLVPALALASTAAGADGLIIEVHPNPPTAMSDAAQQLTFKQYAQLSDQVRSICRTVGMTTEGPQDEED